MFLGTYILFVQDYLTNVITFSVEYFVVFEIITGALHYNYFFTIKKRKIYII